MQKLFTDFIRVYLKDIKKLTMKIGQYLLKTLFSLAILLSLQSATAQQSLFINMAQVDAVELTPDNIFNFTIQATGSGVAAAVVKGTVRFKNSPVSFTYTLRQEMHPGANTINTATAHPQWQFSSSTVQELFMIYKTLPGGSYEYCVSVTPASNNGEPSMVSTDECIYHRREEDFLINLIEPENKARIHEYNPLLAWVANYSFASQLSYRLKVAEVKKGQAPITAIQRNQPVLDEKNLAANSLVYPLYAKPLIKDQPYAWSVDAYYKGILLGVSEVWQFTILDDTLFPSNMATRSYIDIRLENGKTKLYALGQIKLKYTLDKTKKDILSLQLAEGGKQLQLKPPSLKASYGDNRFLLDLREGASLKHMHEYLLTIVSDNNEQFEIPFTYINPDYTK
jgi:hypothetical protein